MDDFTITTRDGYELEASLFSSNRARRDNGPVVLISSALAVRRRFYRHFAQYLADNGARAVMTYDYRGSVARLNRRELYTVRLTDYAEHDMPAALGELRRRYPDSEVIGLGHSFGGQALGLSGHGNAFTRYMTLASGSANLRDMKNPLRNGLLMNGFGPPLAALLGYLPGWTGLGQPLPFGVFNQWRRWCNMPDYLMSDDRLETKSRFHEVHIPIMAVGFEDDPFIGRRNIEAMMAWYSSADIRLRWFTTEETGRPVGHLGFFRRENEAYLWPQIGDWLVRD